MILECDLALLESTNSYESESYSANDKNEYMKPTSYNSALDVGVGYTSVDEHVETCPFEKFDRNEINYEPPKEKQQGTNIRR